MNARRLSSLVAIFAVAWASLWPLVSTTHAWIEDEAMPLCHGAGMQVAPDERPSLPGAPARDGQVHCALCIMAFYAAHASLPEAPPAQLSIIRLALPVERAPLLSPFESPVPPSRAPPAILPA